MHNQDFTEQINTLKRQEKSLREVAEFWRKKEKEELEEAQRCKERAKKHKLLAADFDFQAGLWKIAADKLSGET